jgi:hypothetical protein
MRSQETGFAIEVRQRYRDVVQDRWPAAIAPQPDELLSSWLHRLAIANGVAPRSFRGILGLGVGCGRPASTFAFQAVLPNCSVATPAFRGKR